MFTRESHVHQSVSVPYSQSTFIYRDEIGWLYPVLCECICPLSWSREGFGVGGTSWFLLFSVSAVLNFIFSSGNLNFYLHIPISTTYVRKGGLNFCFNECNTTTKHESLQNVLGWLGSSLIWLFKLKNSALFSCRKKRFCTRCALSLFTSRRLKNRPSRSWKGCSFDRHSFRFQLYE